MNYHHLRYFREVCRAGGLKRAAERLHVAASAVSVQVKALEGELGVALFERTQKKLVLTEAGRIALRHAETIFQVGEDLADRLRHRPSRAAVVRVGAVATLSRNFQVGFLSPVLNRPGTEVVVRSGSLRELLGQLRTHALDLVLANEAVPRDAESPWFSRLLDEQEACLVGHGRWRGRFRFPEDLDGRRMVLPTAENNLRGAFDAMLERAGVRPVVVAEVEDMAMLRLVARESEALALVPRVVVADELKMKTLVEVFRVPELKEVFYAITPTRTYPNPLVEELLAAAERGRQGRLGGRFKVGVRGRRR
ncbi:MAG: LysR family transcriptional regulator [Verrucomicrobiia bacterium]